MEHNGTDSTHGSRPGDSRRLAGGADIVTVCVCAALVIAGGYWVAAKHSNLIGPSLVGVGLSMAPNRWVGMLGGLVLITTGVYQFVALKAVTLIGGVLVLVGVLAVAERGRRD